MQWNERNHIGGADARMLAHMLIEVNKLCGLSSCCKGCGLDGLRRTHKGEDGPVMVGVAVSVQETDSGGAHYRFHQLENDIVATPFGEIGNTFDQWD